MKSSLVCESYGEIHGAFFNRMADPVDALSVHFFVTPPQPFFAPLYALLNTPAFFCCEGPAGGFGEQNLPWFSSHSISPRGIRAETEKGCARATGTRAAA